MSTNPFDQQKSIPGVKQVIAVSSGKGGVGKSTIAAHLACALAKKFRVGLLDADIYGPSQQRLMGALHQKPAITEDQKLIPITRYNVDLMSMGFIVDEASAVVWRGPMLFKAIDQFLRDVQWSHRGELDFLVVDLPPGTGDIQLSLAQKIPMAGAIVISTPQNLAFIDVKKAIDMWQRLNVPILGVVENMSYIRTPAGENMALFPRGEMNDFLKSKGIPKLAEIAFNPDLAKTCEAGVPLIESFPNAPESQIFLALAQQLGKLVNGKTAAEIVAELI